MTISVSVIALIPGFICAMIVVGYKWYSFGKHNGRLDADCDFSKIKAKIIANLYEKIEADEESNDFYDGAIWVLDNLTHKED